MCIGRILLICSSLDGHLGCFLLAVVNDASVNIGVQISIPVPASIPLGVYLGVGFLDHMVILCLTF